MLTFIQKTHFLNLQYIRFILYHVRSHIFEFAQKMCRANINRTNIISVYQVGFEQHIHHAPNALPVSWPATLHLFYYRRDEWYRWYIGWLGTYNHFALRNSRVSFSTNKLNTIIPYNSAVFREREARLFFVVFVCFIFFCSVVFV